MKGNFTTEGLYEATKRKRMLQSLTLPRDINSKEPHAPSNSRQTRPNIALGNDPRSLASERETLQVSQDKNQLENNQNGLFPPRTLRIPANGRRLSQVNGISKGRRHVRALSLGDQSFPLLEQRLSQPNALITEPTRSPMQDPNTYATLWVKDSKVFTEAEPLNAHYDPSSSFSLITLSAAKRLGLGTMIYPPSMHISIMTKLGMVSSKQFVSVEIEASWLSDCELGTFNIAVVSDSLLEPLGVDLLVGKKVIRRLQCKGGLPKESYCYLGIGAAETSPRPRTSPSLGDIPGLVSGNGVWMTQAKSAADCLQPVIEPQSPFTQSNSGLTYNISTSDLPRSTVLTSLSGSIPIQSPVTDAVACQWYESQYGPSQDNYVSQGRVETTPTTQLSSDDHAAQNVFSTSTGCSNSYSAGQGSFTPYTAATHDVSPAIRHIETEYHDKFTQAQGHQLDEIQAGTRAFPHRSQPSFTCANADVTSVSGTWENFISEDSPSIFQGMTNWSFMPEEITRDTLLTSQSHVTALPVPSIRLDTSMSSSRTGSGSSYLESSNNDPGYSHQCYEGEF